MIELKRGKSRLTILPDVGGAIGEWQWDGKDIFLPVSNDALKAQRGVAVGAYPLIPYSNRIANGRFSFEEKAYQLAENMADHPHTIHGNAWEHEWTVAHEGDHFVVLTFDHTPQGQDAEWPFAYRAVLSYQLHESYLDVVIAIENRDRVNQPVGLGYHPFLAAQGKANLKFDAESVWLTTPDGLPTERIPTEGEWSFHHLKDVHARFIDHCFNEFGGHVELQRPDDGVSVSIESAPLFSHLVVFTSPDGPFVAVEPVTNMTDAINHPEVSDRGLHILKPGAQLGGRMRFHIKSL
ncbi:aldose 1-epimerase [Swingsia samuiensis]|uniref:Aldose 1-epimerase n=1 Tax=Swingsia samuiensis TaxID=1293412 RepID=A0A4Y6UMI0_9PROT|nr:aldose 1-epimerase [Swingsia samuiensis]QDH17557.1 aldose 1-epimerase [Swingsia samuiensis]